jgi:hypothetical protein
MFWALRYSDRCGCNKYTRRFLLHVADVYFFAHTHTTDDSGEHFSGQLLQVFEPGRHRAPADKHPGFGRAVVTSSGTSCLFCDVIALLQACFCCCVASKSII